MYKEKNSFWPEFRLRTKTIQCNHESSKCQQSNRFFFVINKVSAYISWQDHLQKNLLLEELKKVVTNLSAFVPMHMRAPGLEKYFRTTYVFRPLFNISGQSVSQPGPQYPCGRELSRQKKSYPGYPGIPIYYRPGPIYITLPSVNVSCKLVIE